MTDQKFGGSISVVDDVIEEVLIVEDMVIIRNDW